LYDCPDNVERILSGLPECKYVVVRDQIVIVEPSSRRIVTVIERRGWSNSFFTHVREETGPAADRLRAFALQDSPNNILTVLHRGFMQRAGCASGGIGKYADLCVERLWPAFLRKQFQSCAGIKTKLVLDDLGFTVPVLRIILGSIESAGNEFDFGFHHKPLLAALNAINDVRRNPPWRRPAPPRS
jgi:hypothetical protein